MKDVKPLYREFREHLSKNRSKFARLQLLCRLEDYLTKEFAVFIFERSNATVLPLLNIGKERDGRRIDLALATGNLERALDKKTAKANPLRIRAFIELKYVSHTQRYGYSRAEDDIGPTLKSLHFQLREFGATEYAGQRVKLRGKKQDTYGVVFASYVFRVHEAEKAATDKPRFVNDIRVAARDRGFQSFNFKSPDLKEVYSDVPVTVLKGEYRVSLFVGLWRRVDASTGAAQINAKAASA